MNGQNNDDSSDSEEERNYTSDEDDELSFESDDEGNYQQNVNKVHTRKVSENDSDFIDGEDEEEELEDSENDEGSEGEEEEIDDEELDGEDDSEDDEESDINETENDAKQSTSQSKSITNRSQKKKSEINSLQSFENELNGGKTNEKDEYAKYDTDDEEDIRNTVGNIPMHWYDEYKHIGYDWDAKKIIRPAKGDMLDDFLKKMEDPDFWRTVKDPQTGQDVVLSDADIELIKRINSQRIPDSNYDDYAVKR